MYLYISPQFKQKATSRSKKAKKWNLTLKMDSAAHRQQMLSCHNRYKS